MWMHQFDESNDTKARNRLSLIDRVRAIKAYEKTPVYQKVGLMFNCSAKQIRNIVKNKHKILTLYSSGQKALVEGPSKADTEKRAKKINFLGKVMHEWFLRARRNPTVGGITYKLLQTVALEVKQVLNVENFFPNNAWLINFRHSYNVDIKEAHSDDPGPISLDVKEIVEHVRERETVESQQTELNYSKWLDTAVSGWNEDSFASSTLHIPNSVATTSSRESSSSLCNNDDDDQPPSKFPKLEPIDVIELDDSDDDDGTGTGGGKSHKHVSLTTVDQALRHLKPLEEFALMKEDFRAIGLISQLEVILTNAKKITANNSH